MIETETESIELGQVPVAVYAAMLGATLVGQFLGMGLDSVVFGHRVVWVPLAASVVLEALVGARFGAARVGQPLSREQRARLSIYYSGILVLFSIPLVGWIDAANRARDGAAAAGASTSFSSLVRVGAAAVVAATAARYALFGVFARRVA
jgi:hypothetical protein